jgi:hypothetical protein
VVEVGARSIRVREWAGQWAALERCGSLGRWRLDVIYLAGKGNVTVHIDKIITSAQCKATWFDPQTGEAAEAGTFPTGNVGSGTFPKWTSQTFSPPSTSEDAVLVLEAC